MFWMHVLLHVQKQYPLLGPPSTRMAQALASGSCQCQLSVLQLPLHLQELETAGLGMITWNWHFEHYDIASGWFLGTIVNCCLILAFSLCFRSVSRASSSNIKPLQIINSTASRCFAFFFLCIWITSVNVLHSFCKGVSNKSLPPFSTRYAE